MPEQLKIIFPVAWILGSIFLLWFSLRLRRVLIKDSALYVSDYFRGFVVPISTISRVTQSFLMHPPTITIHLKHMTPAGNKIVFIPCGPRYYFSENLIVSELELAKTVAVQPWIRLLTPDYASVL
jgi:hypothetical protein